MNAIQTEPVRLVTLAPGHFHAALVQKYRYPEIDPTAFIYSPLDEDLLIHLNHIRNFNLRSDQPTNWQVSVTAGDDFLERFRMERSGNTVVLAGINRQKIKWIESAIESGRDVLVDKPLIIDPEDFPLLERIEETAKERNLLIWDLMTERYDTVNRIIHELIQLPELFGEWRTDSDQPALSLESVHYLKKTVAGQPLVRPQWWFDVATAGDSLADVGTHLVDLAFRFVANAQAVTLNDGVALIGASRYPLFIDQEQYSHLTGHRSTTESASEGQLAYQGNGTMLFTIFGIPVQVTALWGFEAPDSEGDRHTFRANGTRSTIIVTQDTKTLPEDCLTIQPATTNSIDSLKKYVSEWCWHSQARYPGLTLIEHETHLSLVIPRAIRPNHEELFGLVLKDFLKMRTNRDSLPESERINRLTRYFLTTQASHRARIVTSQA